MFSRSEINRLVLKELAESTVIIMMVFCILLDLYYLHSYRHFFLCPALCHVIANLGWRKIAARLAYLSSLRGSVSFSLFVTTLLLGVVGFECSRCCSLNYVNGLAVFRKFGVDLRIIPFSHMILKGRYGNSKAA